MHLIDLYRLQAAGDTVWRHYQALTAQADASAGGSLAALAKARFEKDWETDPQSVIKALEALEGDASKTRVAQLTAAAAREE
jgi:hypothetical protein